MMNKYQTPLEDLHIEDYPQEVQDQFYDCINNIPFVRSLISEDRPRAKDLPRDDEGKIIVDITKPHILENMDYFREVGIHFQKTGRYTDLRVNGNPNSEFMKWLIREIDRCHNGMVRPEDGEWIPGDFYYLLNYMPIQLTKEASDGSKAAVRVIDLPRVFEGHYYKYHYLFQARKAGNHAVELAKRGCGKSIGVAEMLAKRFLLGESWENNQKVTCYITASDRAKLVGGDQTLDKFQYAIDFCADHTQFPAKRLTNTMQNMIWQAGYMDLDTGVKRGTLNAVVGRSSNADVSKLRGSRGVLYILEEAGSFSNLLEVYNNLRPSVEDGSKVFGMLYLIGTAGDSESDFSSLQEIMYHPDGYNAYGVKNVYDKEGQGRPKFTYFFPAYLNREGCYDKDGNSDVTKALLELLLDRYKVKYNSTDINAIAKRTAELPITPQEAILRSRGNMFPVTELSARLNEIDNNPSFYDSTYVGDLELKQDGTVKFVPTGDKPIRDFPTKDNKVEGAIEIFQMPEKGRDDKPIGNRYIIGVDPIDDDEAETMSLYSTFVLDLWTDQIVAEYTGRKMYADDCFETTRRLCLFYNAKCLYEAHPYSQLVHTPDGEKKWGDIKIGDKLFSPHGGTVDVVDIPIDGEDDIYEITFVDGRKVRASKNHIWSVYKLGSGNKLFNVTTDDLLRSELINKHKQHRFFVPNAKAVEYNKKDLPIEPYTLGLCIAEGSIRGTHCKRGYVQISSCENDADFYKSALPYDMKHIGKSGYSYHLYMQDCKQKFMDLGLYGTNSATKFIPTCYMESTYEDRLELLKGLMDGDGCAVKTGASVYITTSKQLANDIITLCHSLGIPANFNAGKDDMFMLSPQNNKVYKVKQSYRVAIHAAIPIFKLPRKIDNQHIYNENAKGSKAKGFLYKTAINSIDYVGRERCKCVTVSAKDGLYLIGDYITTHNCNKKGLYAYFSRMYSSYLLAETPEYLKDKDIIKTIGIGNKAYGVNATLPVNNFANKLIRDWLLKPVPVIEKTPEGEEIETTKFNLSRIKNRALLKELILFNPDINVDRIRALGMVMLYREQFMIMYGGDLSGSSKEVESDYLGLDDYFTRNYDGRFLDD